MKGDTFAIKKKSSYEVSATIGQFFFQHMLQMTNVWSQALLIQRAKLFITLTLFLMALILVAGWAWVSPFVAHPVPGFIEVSVLHLVGFSYHCCIHLFIRLTFPVPNINY